jgi:signal transduction histidine kinase
MTDEKRNLLESVHKEFFNVMLNDFAHERLNDIVIDDVMGYGTTIDEKIFDLAGLQKLTMLQKEQAKDLEIQISSSPVHRKITDDGNVAIYVDEVLISMVMGDGKNEFNARVSTILEFQDGKWKIIHWHGSKPVESEGDTWHKEEWKQKNEALQKLVDEKTADLENKNYELEIEAALERVRAVAMSMQNPDDLLGVCYVISEQLVKLNVNNIRNVQLAIINKQNKTYSNYQFFTAYSKKVFEETGYDENPASMGLVREMRKSANSFFIGSLKGTELKEFRDWRKRDNQFPDPIMDDLSEVFYYFYSIGEGGLGLTTYKAISDNELEIFKRFHLVFKLAYRRFIDIQHAEEQAREAKIEVALERVRSRTMGMQKSEELKEVIQVVYEQFIHLKINLDHAGFVVDYTPKGNWHFWIADQREIPSKITHPYFDSIWAQQFNEAIEKGIDFFATNLNFKEKNKFYQDMFKYIPELPEASKEFYFKSAGLAGSTVLIDNVGLYIENFSGIPYSDEDNKTLMRFGKVFHQTYTRFLDLQKAEAQALESQIEATLERVRSRTMGMQRSDELQDAAVLMFDQIEALGVQIMGCGFNIWDEDWKAATAWMSGMDRIQPPFKTSSSEDIFLRVYEAAQRGESLFVEEQTGAELVEHYKYMASIPVFKKILDQLSKKGLSAPSFQIMHCAYFSQGYLMFITLEPATEAHDIFKRFAKVFEQTYTRFLDLKRAEAQAREARIEASLERVRSRTMAMHHTSEIQAVINTVHEELLKLNISIVGGSFVVINKDIDTELRAWGSGGTADTKSEVLIPNFGKPFTTNLLKGIQQGPGFFTEEFTNQEKIEYFTELFKHEPWSKLTNKQKKETLESSGGYTRSCCVLNHTSILIINQTGRKFSEEENDILKRFTRVFEQTYTRFLDLQKAEAQAREATKQASLDRVRGEIASMRSTDDLQRITPLIWQELEILDVPFNRCGVFIVDETASMVQVYLTTPDAKSLAMLNMPTDANELTRITVEHWCKQTVYTQHWNKNDFKAWAQSMVDLGQIQTEEEYQGDTTAPETLDLHFIPFRQGMLYVGNSAPLNEDKIALVKSLAKAFSIAYARYEDFKQLESAKNKIETTLNELKATQTQLIQSEKMASLGELTAGIAHEIQNPLNFVNNFSEVNVELIAELKEELEAGNLEDIKAIADDIAINEEKILQHGKRADAIVKGMLQHSRSSNGVKEPTDINALADEYLRLSYHGLRAKDKSFNADFKTEFDESLPEINIIPQDIGRVLLNLINNAFYACTERRLLSEAETSRSVVAERQRNLTSLSNQSDLDNHYEPTVTVSTKNLGESIEISVKDNGNGIPEEIKKKIFQPFFSTKPTGQGTGLGLSLSYDIVKAHGGELNAETKEGEGTEFIIQLSTNN